MPGLIAGPLVKKFVLTPTTMFVVMAYPAGAT